MLEASNDETVQFYQNICTVTKANSTSKKTIPYKIPTNTSTSSNTNDTSDSKLIYIQINPNQPYWSGRIYKFLGTLTEIKSWPKDEKNCNNCSFFI